MLLSDSLWFFHKTIIALSGGHFEYFLSFPKKITLVYRLEREGLVTLIPNVGARVINLSYKDVSDIYDILIVLEATAARLACLKISDEQIRKLEECHFTMAKAAGKGNLDLVFEMNVQFHWLITESTRNPYLVEIRGAQRGLKITLIEEDRLGGTCLNRGCIPTKTLLHHADLYASVSKSKVFGDQSIPVHYEKIVEAKDEVVKKVVGGIQRILAAQQVEVIKGEASLINPSTASVTKPDRSKEEVQGKSIVIATGAKSEPDPILRVDGERIIGTEEALNLNTFPKSLAVIGGGRRGVEFATFFNTFGTKVTLIEKEAQILPRMDREISVRLRAILVRQGIKVLTNTVVSNVDTSGEFPVLVVLGKKGTEKIEAEKVLVPGTRKANLKNLSLERAGIQTKDGFISVNQNFETSVKGVFAVGDVMGGHLSAHHALATGLSLIDHLTGKEISYNERQIPFCVYTKPEVASIGLTQEEAEKGQEIVVGKFPFAGAGMAQCIGEEDGVVKFVVDKKYGEILGVHIIGPQATELISMAALAMKNEFTVDMIGSIILPHPSLSEAITEAVWDLKNEAIHSLKNW
jgi:dihydrolipoamide dehydrogenase